MFPDFKKIRIGRKQLIISLLRLLIAFAAALAFSYPLHKDTFTTYFNRTIIKLHTLNVADLSTRLSNRFSYLLEIQDIITLQHELNDNFGMLGLIITDCTEISGVCSSDKVLFTSSPELPWKIPVEKIDRKSSSFVILYGAEPLKTEIGKKGTFIQLLDDSGNIVGRQILGRLYLFNNLPTDFHEDFFSWIRAPFKDVGPHRLYLKTTFFFLLGAVFAWLSLELSLANRRLQISIAKKKGDDFRKMADAYLNQLEDKNSLLTEIQDYALQQFFDYDQRIKELEKRVENDEEFKEIAEELIEELESESEKQQQRYGKELENVCLEIESLQVKLVEYEKANDKRKEEIGEEMESAFRPMFSNPFERHVFESLSTSEKSLNGAWRVIPNFNVGTGKNFSQFVDALVITPDAIIVVEAKNYPGVIVSDGDIENTKWHYHNPKRREIRCMWGLNPYHQINQYCMSVLTLINTRSRYKIPIFGLLVFPDKADLSGLGYLGSFYSAVNYSALMKSATMFAEKGRSNCHQGRKPTVLEIEDILSGRKKND